MPKNLVIVESPAKAKTIEGYLGKDFLVKSSFGHVRDLPHGNISVDVENGFKPTYEVSKDKKDVVKELKKLAKDAETVWLATDDDREGEAISWHLKEVLDLDDAKSRRIVFREITKQAILNAIESPRNINSGLVDAQQARRILDRLVGYEISPLLWKKIKRGLSAGRVQSVAVRLIVEREREIDQFNAKSAFRVQAIFDLDNNKKLKADLGKRFDTEAEAEAFLKTCIGANFVINKLEKKPGKKSPSAPFTTSTLQQEASRKLGFSVAQTMTLAQRLYEAGKITYMRTDSVNLSDFAIQASKDEITKSYGNEYVQTRQYKTKGSSAQEAHEAIRPTDFSTREAGNERNEERLYELIWKRAIASQMTDAKLEKTVATIGISTSSETLTATGEVIVFDGFLKVYEESVDEDAEEENSTMLPPLNEGQDLSLNNLTATERFTRPPARYTEASLVRTLEEKGIGRPSTYAPTITTVQKRGYVLKESRDGRSRDYKELVLENGNINKEQKTETTGAEKNKLFPTDLAMIVNDFLVDRFPNVTDYSFTAKVEEDFDKIAAGEKQWDKMIEDFYGKFHKKVETTEEDTSYVNTVRELGVDPKSGKKVYVRLARFGPVAQIGEVSEEEGAEKPQYSGLRKGQLLESITLEEALELFKLPRDVGTFEGDIIVAGIGRFGPYIRHQNKFVSIRDEDPHTIEEERAIELIKEKRIADANKFIKDFPENPDVQVLNGRYGPYIKVGRKNVKIPKDKEPKDLTLEECLELAEKTPDKKGRGGKKAAKTKSKSKGKSKK